MFPCVKGVVENGDQHDAVLVGLARDQIRSGVAHVRSNFQTTQKLLFQHLSLDSPLLHHLFSFLRYPRYPCISPPLRICTLKKLEKSTLFTNTPWLL